MNEDECCRPSQHFHLSSFFSLCHSIIHCHSLSSFSFSSSSLNFLSLLTSPSSSSSSYFILFSIQHSVPTVSVWEMELSLKLFVDPFLQQQSRIWKKKKNLNFLHSLLPPGRKDDKTMGYI